MDLSNLGVVQGAEQSDYDKYLNQLNQYNTDRNFSYGQFLDELDAQNLRRENELNNAILAGQYGDYSYLNNMGINTDNNPTALQQQAELQALAQAQVDNILQTGNMPSAALLQQAGYSQEYANYLSQYYRQQLSAGNTVGGGTGRRSSGGNSGNGGTKGGKPINDDKRTETGGIDQAAIDAAINAAVDISNKISGKTGQGNRGNGDVTLSPAAQSILNSYQHVNPGTSSNVAEVFADRIETALRNGSITEQDASYLLGVLGV